MRSLWCCIMFCWPAVHCLNLRKIFERMHILSRWLLGNCWSRHMHSLQFRNPRIHCWCYGVYRLWEWGVFPWPVLPSIFMFHNQLRVPRMSARGNVRNWQCYKLYSLCDREVRHFDRKQ